MALISINSDRNNLLQECIEKYFLCENCGNLLGEKFHCTANGIIVVTHLRPAILVSLAVETHNTRKNPLFIQISRYNL